MAYTAPSVRSTGDVITSGHWNTDIKDNILWFATDKPMCLGYDSNGASCGNGSIVSIGLNVQFDNASMITTASRISAPVNGTYQFGASATFDGSGVTACGLLFRLDGGSNYYGAGGGGPYTSGTIKAPVGGTTFKALTAGQYMEARITQNSVGSVVYSSTAQPAQFWGIWMGT